MRVYIVYQPVLTSLGCLLEIAYECALVYLCIIAVIYEFGTMQYIPVYGTKCSGGSLWGKFYN